MTQTSMSTLAHRQALSTLRREVEPPFDYTKKPLSAAVQNCLRDPNLARAVARGLRQYELERV